MRNIEKLKWVLSLIAAQLRRLGSELARVFLKIFPRRAARYFDADLHEVKYILWMALYAFVINLYIETFARLQTGIMEGIRWAVTHPVIFLYNMLIIFSTMTLALLFKRRRFAWFIISLVWIIIGSVNGAILLSRMTPFTLYDMQNFADGLTIMTTYYSMWQIILGAIVLVLGTIAIVMIFIRSEKWRNIRYKKSIAAILVTAALTASRAVMEQPAVTAAPTQAAVASPQPEMTAPKPARGGNPALSVILILAAVLLVSCVAVVVALKRAERRRRARARRRRQAQRLRPSTGSGRGERRR